jgi:lipopolysaccharide/colanic/teichoic acid biosynthesis glycosyltransferase
VIARPTPARVIDVLCAGTLLAIASPILAVAALVIRVTDGAPVFFRQQRLGRGRRPFQIIKLRTMTAGQVTPLGEVLRNLGVDELPQLINVLRGEMALVGPRALTEEDARRLGWDAAAFDLRWAVPPGITGPAQIAPVRRCHPRTTWRLDRRYVLRHSPCGDAAILAASVLVPLLGKRRARQAARALAGRSP